MVRRLLLLLMVPHLALPPVAGAGHAHDGEPVGHARAPHFHTAALLGALHGLPGPGDDRPGEPEPADHDADAVYLPPFDALLPARDAADDPPPLGLVAGWFAVPVAVGAPSPRPSWSHPPPHPRPCPLYLQVRALLI